MCHWWPGQERERGSHRRYSYQGGCGRWWSRCPYLHTAAAGHPARLSGGRVGSGNSSPRVGPCGPYGSLVARSQHTRTPAAGCRDWTARPANTQRAAATHWGLLRLLYLESFLVLSLHIVAKYFFSVLKLLKKRFRRWTTLPWGGRVYLHATWPRSLVCPASFCVARVSHRSVVSSRSDTSSPSCLL